MERPGSSATGTAADAAAELRAEKAGSRKLLPALALATLVVLAIMPGTRMLLREQLWAQISSRSPEPTAAAFAAAAGKNRGDYQIELAAASERVREAASEQAPVLDIAPLNELRARWGDSPSLLANLLRHITRRTRPLERPEPDLLAGGQLARPVPARELEKAEIDRWIAFDQAAGAGERLDPQNAYFPFMRSIGLFALGRDAEALSAIDRAGCLTRWEEYLGDEVEGRLRIHAPDRANATARMRDTALYSVLLPHYGGLRKSARTAIYHAVEAERAGRHEQGFRIRRAVARCGGVMRAESRWFAGALIGVSVMETSLLQSGGAASDLKRSDTESLESIRRRRIEQHLNQVVKIGHPEEAAWVRSEARAIEQFREIADRSRTAADSGAVQRRLMNWWWIDHLLAANILWLLLIGFAATLASRANWVREARPAPWNLRAAALALLAGLTGLAVQNHWPGLGLLIPVGPILFLLVVIGADLRRPASGGSLAPPLAAMAGAFCAAALLAAGQGLSMADMLAWETEIACYPAPVDGWIWPLLPAELLRETLAAPGLAAVALAICSFILRVPLAAGLVRGFRGASVPLACALVLVYGGCVLMTAGAEQEAGRLLDGPLEHEGRLFAALSGREWPGRTP